MREGLRDIFGDFKTEGSRILVDEECGREGGGDGRPQARVYTLYRI